MTSAYHEAPVYQNQSFSIRWLDAAHTIQLLEATEPWQWPAARDAVNESNRLLWAQTVPTDVVIALNHAPAFVPGGSFFKDLRSVFQEPPMERLVILTSRYHVVKTFLDLIARIYAIRGIEERYFYRDTVEEALALIAQRRSRKTGELPPTPPGEG